MSTPNRVILAVVGLLAGIGIGGVLMVLQLGSGKTVKFPTPPPVGAPLDATPEPTVLPGGPVAHPASGKLTIYKLKMTEDGTSLEKQAFHSDADRPEAQAIAAISAMAGAEPSPLPKGTRVVSIEFAGPLVTLDLSPEFRDNFSGGETMEALALNAITGTLGQFDGVKKVQILVGGKKIDSLGGAQSLKEPLTVAEP